MDRVNDETRELSVAVTEYGWSAAADKSERVGKEAADVANMAMMVADMCGALTPGEA